MVFTANKLNFGIEARPHQKIRFRATGEPLSRSQVFGWLDWTPGNWLSSFHIESAIGERGDVANNRIGRGYYFQANATIRLFNRWEIQPRFEESVINHKDNVAGTATIIRERAGQLTSVYHLTARDSVRLIAQYNGTRRAPSLYESRVTPFDKTETRSLVYSHKRGLGTNFYLGRILTNSCWSFASSCFVAFSSLMDIKNNNNNPCLTTRYLRLFALLLCCCI